MAGPAWVKVISSYLRDLGWGRGTAAAAAAKSCQSCPTLCNPIDSSPPGSPVHCILRARTLEWVSVSISRPELNKIKNQF